MKRIFSVLFLLAATMTAVRAEIGHCSAQRNAISGGYDFWVYTPGGYGEASAPLPLVIFLHGASLCGNKLERVRHYGVLHAIDKGKDIPALVVAPQNPGGAWRPSKVNDVLEWTKAHYAVDTTRVYVIGMSLGGYGTMDFVGTYPGKVAAAMALCGGCSLKDFGGLGDVPLWIMHGTADRAVPLSKSKAVVRKLQAQYKDSLLRYDWLPGAGHGTPARAFYLNKTYDWLFAHRIDPEGKRRTVNRTISITMADLRAAYQDLRRPYMPAN